jgi:hypothetical protein
VLFCQQLQLLINSCGSLAGHRCTVSATLQGSFLVNNKHKRWRR